ncbi:hypothetical protein TSAR_007681 [Trichomalopsis sarcophagae]|uniref:Odorant receptor n=1 Tax=Trichomalopsis sarcophagae TaxID=543379 RepID=A0A232F305_9HYME|nr:hypothetical protein TSAR_007681 [Trichomalopsis sarcophagae]
MTETKTKEDVFAYYDERMKKPSCCNEKFEEDVKYAIALNRRIANAIGIWPIFSSTGARLGFDICVKTVKNAAVYVLLSFLLVPGILHIVVEEGKLKAKILKVRLEILSYIFRIIFYATRCFSDTPLQTGPMILNTMALLKYSVMLFRKSQIQECLKQLESDWRKAGNDELRALMRRNTAVGHRLSRVCVATFYVGGIFYRLIKTLLTPIRYTKDGLMIKPLPSPLYKGLFRFNTSASPVYETIFATQMMSGFVVHSTTVTTCSYAALLATHACGQLDIVMYLLKRLIEDDGDNGRLTRVGNEAVDRKLRVIVQLHLKVLRFISSVEDLMNQICLVEIFGGSTILCLTSFYFIMDLQNNDALGLFTYMVMITSLIALLFTYCYVGEIVSDKAKKVGAKTYMINWYDLPPKKGLCIGLIISVAHSPVQLTAGKMLELSMYNFGCVRIVLAFRFPSRCTLQRFLDITEILFTDNEVDRRLFELTAYDYGLTR